MRGAVPPLPQYVFMAWCLAKHRDNFNFYRSSSLCLVQWTSLQFAVAADAIYKLTANNWTCRPSEHYLKFKREIRVWAESIAVQ
jgi:hypothetical protein